MRVVDLPDPSEPWTIDVGGVAIRFELRGQPTLAGHVQQLLGPAPVIEAGQAELAADHVVVLDLGPPPPAPAAVTTGDGFELLLEPSGVWISAAAATLYSVVQPDEGSAEPQRHHLHVKSTVPSTEAYLLVMTFFNLVALQNHWVPVHSALLQSPAGAFLVVGASGRGKSTTSGAALRAGWAVGADDICFLRHSAAAEATDGAREVEILGLPRSLSVPDEAVPAHHRHHASAATDHRNRRRLSSFDRPDDWQQLAGCIEVDHGGSPRTTIGPLGALELTQALIRCEALASTDPDHVALSMGMVKALSTRPSHLLALGTDAAERLDSTAAALAGLAAPSHHVEVAA